MTADEALGPPLIGGLAQAVSLTAAVVVLASALLAIGVRQVG